MENGVVYSCRGPAAKKRLLGFKRPSCSKKPSYFTIVYHTTSRANNAVSTLRWKQYHFALRTTTRTSWNAFIPILSVCCCHRRCHRRIIRSRPSRV